MSVRPGASYAEMLAAGQASIDAASAPTSQKSRMVELTPGAKSLTLADASRFRSAVRLASFTRRFGRVYARRERTLREDDDAVGPRCCARAPTKAPVCAS